MNQNTVQTLASAMRELRNSVQIIPFDTDLAEEAIALPSQQFISPERWCVMGIETWSKEKNCGIRIKNVWDEMIYFMGEERTNIKVEFRYFVDGIQRTTPIGKVALRKSTYQTVPIHLAQIGIALITRRKRRIEKQNEKIKLLIEYPSSFVMSVTNIPSQQEDLLKKIREMVGEIIEGVDTSYRIARLKEDEEGKYDDVKVIEGIKYPRIDNDELWKWCADPGKFRGQARRWTTRYRDVIEQSVYDKALENFGGEVEVGKKYVFVVKDGPLTHVRGELVKGAIGIIKSFRTVFVKRSEMTKVLNLQVGYRSPVFVQQRPDGNFEECDNPDSVDEEPKNKLISWYVRIRPVGRHDPTWGLIRVEMHVSSIPCKGHAGRWKGLDTEIIDKISKRIMEEANPTSHPDPRWHNLIYPIRCCERFLRSRIMPHVTARYLLGGS